MGANNPVGEVKCLVSIGTGVPSPKPFIGDVFHIGEMPVAIAKGMEQTDFKTQPF